MRLFDSSGFGGRLTWGDAGGVATFFTWMKMLLFLCLTTTMALAGAPVPVPEEKVSNLIERIRRVIPEGWSVIYKAEYAMLEVKQDKPVLLEFFALNMREGEAPRMGEAEFSFRVLEGFTQVEYDRLAAENAKIQKEASAVYDELVSRSVGQKFDSFTPHKEEDKKLVARYEGLKKSMHELPDLRDGNLGLRWGYNRPGGYMGSHPAEKAAHEKFEAVRERVVKLFVPYVNGGKSGTLQD